MFFFTIDAISCFLMGIREKITEIHRVMLEFLQDEWQNFDARMQVGSGFRLQCMRSWGLGESQKIIDWKVPFWKDMWSFPRGVVFMKKKHAETVDSRFQDVWKTAGLPVCLFCCWNQYIWITRWLRKIGSGWSHIRQLLDAFKDKDRELLEWLV